MGRRTGVRADFHAAVVDGRRVRREDMGRTSMYEGQCTKYKG